LHATSAVAAAASRRLAANLLEAQLLRLARAGAVIERRLGPGLLALSARHLYRRLGFVRLGDYLTERLGMSLRRCQSILRLERALRDLPVVAAAFDAGALPPSKVRVVASAATPDTQELWLARAQRLTVRDLEAAARAARPAKRLEETDPASREAGGDGVVPAGLDVGPDEPASAAPGEPASAQPDEPAPAAPAAPTLAALAPAAPDAATDTAPGAFTDIAPEDEPGVLISFAAPGRAFAVWHWALEFVRRVAGRQEPAWSCAEYLAAEFLSGCPDTEEAAAHASAPPIDRAGSDPAPTSGPVRRPSRCAISDEEVWARAVAAVRDALRPLGTAADPESILSTPPVAGSGAPPEPILSTPPAIAPEAPPEPIPPGPPPATPEASDPNPWDLDGRLRGFLRFRQSLAWRQGRLLAAVAALDLYRDLGYDSLGDWCRCVLGMSPRRARYLVSLDRRLDRLPLVADAYRRGLVSWCHARLLVRVARHGTESRWVRYARQVTVRRLEDVVTAYAVTAADPALGGQDRTSQDGAPLPPTEPLPGNLRSSPTETRRPPDPQPARHTFAPPDGTSAVPGDALASPGDALASSGDALASPGDVPVAPDPHADATHGAATQGATTQGAARHTFAPEPCAHRIAFWAPLDVAAVWRSALRACRRTRGPHLRDWECLLIFIIEMRDAWQPHENAEWRRRYRVLERDGWRCRAPGCTSRSHLNAHHVEFRSRCGGDEMANLVTLCVGHHQAGVHENRIRCYGRAPDAIWWELGIRPDAPPLVRYFGERIVGAVESDPCGGARERPVGATDHGAAGPANGDGTAGRPAVKAPGPG
jgi:hypothetical protein